MPKTTEQIKQIAAQGGNVSVDATSKTTEQLKQIVQAAAQSGATVIIRNADSKTTEQLKQIASLAPGKVTFEV